MFNFEPNFRQLWKFNLENLTQSRALLELTYEKSWHLKKVAWCSTTKRPTGKKEISWLILGWCHVILFGLILDISKLLSNKHRRIQIFQQSFFAELKCSAASAFHKWPVQNLKIASLRLKRVAQTEQKVSTNIEIFGANIKWSKYKVCLNILQKHHPSLMI